MRVQSKQNLIKLIVYVAIAYLLFRPVWRSASFSVKLEKAGAHQVWEFVSDLSNAKILNPLIYKFDIVKETGNYDHWEYGAVIYETMSHIPLLTNVNYADFILKPSPNKDHFWITSTYQTCFFRYGCLNSTSNMSFSKVSGGTKFAETIEYQCPWVFTWLCSTEVNDVKQGWMKRLQSHLTK